jgi:hypothetical protein
MTKRKTAVPKLQRSDVEQLTAPSGRTLLAFGAGYYGRGKTGAEALRNAMKAAGFSTLVGERMIIYEAPADAYVDDGAIVYVVGEPAKELVRGVVT